MLQVFYSGYGTPSITWCVGNEFPRYPDNSEQAIYQSKVDKPNYIITSGVELTYLKASLPKIRSEAYYAPSGEEGYFNHETVDKIFKHLIQCWGAKTEVAIETSETKVEIREWHKPKKESQEMDFYNNGWPRCLS